MNSSDNSRFRYIPTNRKEIKDSTWIPVGFHLRCLNRKHQRSGKWIVARIVDSVTIPIGTWDQAQRLLGKRNRTSPVVVYISAIRNPGACVNIDITCTDNSNFICFNLQLCLLYHCPAPIEHNNLEYSLMKSWHRLLSNLTFSISDRQWAKSISNYYFGIFTIPRTSWDCVQQVSGNGIRICRETVI